MYNLGPFLVSSVIKQKMKNPILLRRTMCTTPAPTPPTGSDPKQMTARYRPSEMQKFFLVWTKKYKTKKDIPTFVSAELIERSRSEARIKISNRLMILTALASLTAIYLGKSAAQRGESIYTINQDFHKKYQEEYNKTHAGTTK